MLPETIVESTGKRSHRRYYLVIQDRSTYIIQPLPAVRGSAFCHNAIDTTLKSIEHGLGITSWESWGVDRLG